MSFSVPAPITTVHVPPPVAAMPPAKLASRSSASFIRFFLPFVAITLRSCLVVMNISHACRLPRHGRHPAPSSEDESIHTRLVELMNTGVIRKDVLYGSDLAVWPYGLDQKP
ncbi:Os01g0788850 [Oryza sativa Japonica Group]|uniref:Os01g0788850 protein n=1 Tax=Oryza sativa subsp. japonica TaxID=39947 RepID=A0A0P0V923_ORYSJ|nr:hypothetical protein EE612_006191 [Oryza sativa]BAS74714.1 Os01g0788850 [Oryza sativa Japonica Group]